MIADMSDVSLSVLMHSFINNKTVATRTCEPYTRWCAMNVMIMNITCRYLIKCMHYHYTCSKYLFLKINSQSHVKMLTSEEVGWYQMDSLHKLASLTSDLFTLHADIVVHMHNTVTTTGAQTRLSHFNRHQSF